MKASLFATLAAAFSPLAAATPILNSGIDPEVSFTSAVSSAVEGPTVVTVVVSLSQVATAPVSIPYSRSGSAVVADATVPTGPLVIPIGASAGSIDVTLVDDGDSEGRERVVLTLGTPTGGVLGATTVHEVIIEDDEASADISFDMGATAANEGDGVVPVTLTLSAPRTEEARVSFTQTGTATPGGVDVATSPSSPIVFPAGSTTATVDVILVQDPIDEPSETFALTLLAPINGVPRSHGPAHGHDRGR